MRPARWRGRSPHRRHATPPPRRTPRRHPRSAPPRRAPRGACSLVITSPLSMFLVITPIRAATPRTLERRAAAARSSSRPTSSASISTPTNCSSGAAAARGSARLPWPEPQSSTVEPRGSCSARSAAAKLCTCSRLYRPRFVTCPAPPPPSPSLVVAARRGCAAAGTACSAAVRGECSTAEAGTRTVPRLVRVCTRLA